uniref:BOS complex subunit TMEM147 n=1 Tax=Scapholeberis mucronata TaxID=202097 RepID=A0A4Y7NM09_9CRUS|nr:EOG090X0CTK [Scapholeberis mucronata]SVE93863.1 EOG090X0CTK [Scapholeberis mucronata]
MTLYHFGNCLALSYIPFWIVYKYCGLSEYGAFWKCVQAGGVYALTQLGKMLLLATFFPTAGDYSQEDPNNFSPLQELLKCTVDLIDLVGISVVMSRIAGKGHTKVLIAGLGWAGAELVLSRLLVFWVGARGTEFDWKYIQKSFEANISIVHFLAVTALVWLYSRHDLPRHLLPAVVILIGFHSYKSVICDVVAHVLSIYSWSLLAFKAVFSITLGLIVLHIYGGVASLACSFCNCLLTEEVQSRIPCVYGRVILTKAGNIVHRHQRDPTWNLTEHVQNLKASLKTWRRVYWRLWSQTHFLECSSCCMPFAAADFMKYRPKTASSSQDSVSTAGSAESDEKFRKVVNVLDPHSLCYEDDEDMQEDEVEDLLGVTLNKPAKCLGRDGLKRGSQSQMLGMRRKFSARREYKIKPLPPVKEIDLRWNPCLSSRSNQDSQRYMEDEMFRRIVNQLAPSQWQKARPPVGGLFAKINRILQDKALREARQAKTVSSAKSISTAMTAALAARKFKAHLHSSPSPS